MNKEEKKIMVREYTRQDEKEIQKICIETSVSVFQKAEMQNMLLTAFCNYYINEEPENCFVAVKGTSVAGYILSTENSAVWAEKFEKNYIAVTDDHMLKHFYQEILKTPLKYAKDYPAHLHIDILDEYQSMGIGTMLMERLVKHLKEKGVSGLMLSVACDNVKGQKFYEKFGFHELETTLEERVMGMKLTNRQI